jgi:hypothetical protein
VLRFDSTGCLDVGLVRDHNEKTHVTTASPEADRNTHQPEY